MSAITGIFYRDDQVVSLKIIEKMNDCLSHRGPDGSYVWHQGEVALGHQMLHTTPESLKEKLPFEDPKSGLVITSDARIDNRSELAPLLHLEDVKEVPDSLFILKTYQKWGENCTKKLLGDFAFVIWDKNRKVIFGARDHMGVKPFYYHLSKTKFLFASEIKAILGILKEPYKINEDKIADHLVPLSEDKEMTFYQNILRLPPSHSILVSLVDENLKQYWSLDPEKKIFFNSDEEYFMNFRKIFDEAVKCRLRSINPVGCRLSGGLDSSSIVSVAKNLLQKDDKPKLKTFSAVFDDLPECDERHYINKLVDSEGIQPFFIRVHEFSPLYPIKMAMKFLDEPFYAPNYYINHYVFSEAQKQSVRVLLDGVDGDRIVSHGNGYLVDLFREIKIKKLFKEVRGISNRLGVNPLTILLFKVIFPQLPPNIKKYYRKFRGVNEVRNLDFINSELAKRTEIKKIYEESYVEPLMNNIGSRDIHYLILNTGVVQHFLELADHRAAQFSIEARHPFYDKRLVEFCYAIPTNLKIRDGWDRFILRSSMDNLLPPEIQWRPKKTDIGINFVRNIIKFDMKDIDDLFQNLGIIEKYIDLKNLNFSYDKLLNEKCDLELFKLWKVITLIIWSHTLDKIVCCSE